MTTTKNEINEAIALAKAVRQTALANAKVALEEQFNKNYQALFAEKLEKEAGVTAPAMEDEIVNEGDLDALIKELESGIEGGTSPTGADSAPAGDESGAAPMAAPTAATATPAPEGTTAPEGTPVVQAPVIVVAPAAESETSPEVPASPEGGESPELPPTGASGGEEMDEINLDELLESLKEELEEEEEGKKMLDEDTKLTSSGIGGKTGGSDNKKPASGASSSSKIESGGLTDNGVPEGKVEAKDATTAKRPNEAKNATSTNLSTPKLGGTAGPALKAARPNSKGEFENTTKINEQSQTIKEQSAAINLLKNELNEINLLNAKLLYTNKLFKENSVNGEQKLRIVEMFDLSKNIREVKMTYANIAESLSFSATAPKKATSKSVSPSKVQSITEGLATGAVGSTKPTKEIISETAKTVNRFQELAGIKLQVKK